MKKSAVCILFLGLLCFAGIGSSYALNVGPGMRYLKKGRYSFGTEFERSGRTFDVEVPGARLVQADANTLRTLVTGSYAFDDNFALTMRLGGSDFDGGTGSGFPSVPIASSADINSKTNFSYGVGMWINLLDHLNLPFTDVNIGGNYFAYSTDLPAGKVDVDEFQVQLTFEREFLDFPILDHTLLFAGFRGSDFEAKFSTSTTTGENVAGKFKATDHVGIFAGGDWFITDNLSAGIEGRFLDTLGLGLSLTYLITPKRRIFEKPKNKIEARGRIVSPPPELYNEKAPQKPRPFHKERNQYKKLYAPPRPKRSVRRVVAPKVVKPKPKPPILSEPNVRDLYKKENLKDQAEDFVRAHDYSSAEKSLRKAIQIDPSDPSLYFQLGRVYYLLKNWSAAATAFQRTIEIDPNYPSARRNLGVIQKRLRK